LGRRSKKTGGTRTGGQGKPLSGVGRRVINLKKWHP